MLKSISEVNACFFGEFQSIAISRGGIATPITVRYAKNSSADYSEETENQIYPCIAIQDYSPSLKQEWFFDMRDRFGGVSSDGITGMLIKEPLWLEIRYDVSIASKQYLEFMLIKDVLYKDFVYNKSFIFNKRTIGDNSVGDVVSYNTRVTDIPRTDGVFETNFEFTLFPWVHFKTPEDVTLIQNVLIELTQNSL